MKKMNRCFAWILLLCMVVALLPARSHAAEQANPGTSLNAAELPGVSRLDTASEQTPAYADDEMVTVIVMMEDPAVMDYFGVDTFSAEQSAGEAVAAFLASDDAQELSQELLQGQQEVIEKIGTAADAQDEMQVIAQWTGLVNGLAVRIPYGRLEQVKALPGVRNAYVEREYERPAEPVTQAGIAGYSYDMVNLSGVWSAGYYGEGMLVAVLDTGLDLTYASWGDSANPETGVRRVHEAFTGDSFKTNGGLMNVRWTESGIARFLETTQLNANTGSDGQLIVYPDNALYKNRKVPFACDYADGDANVQPSDSDHGTHVAGTIAGCAVTDEGQVVFSGVAPDAQILAMKVFPDDTASGAKEYAILNALEDAAKLGADVVNLSLGSDNGFANDDTLASFAYARLRESGVLFMVSAGNAGYSSANNNRGDYNLSSDPDISMVSSPSTYRDTLSIASVDNVISAESVLTWTDTDGTETDVSFADPFDVAMKAMFVGEDVAVIPVDGAGTYNDYYNAGFRGYYGYGDKGVSGIALIRRGGVNESGESMTFEEKINNATRFSWSYYDSAKGYYVTEYPVKAVIIYDSDPDSTELIYMSVDNALLTSCFISGKDGAALFDAAKAAIAAGTQVTLTVQAEDRILGNETGYQISSFSSWGAAPGLELKPEITAPGGNIWSAVMDQSYSPANPGGLYDDYTGSYGMMSGTSMSAPHMTGIAALVKQYIQKNGYATGTAAADLTEKLLVSTAVPLSHDGVFYSPRAQGAGLVNAGAAVTSPAYISVEGQNVGKLELKDDPDKTGEYVLTFRVNNLTGSPLSYTGTVYVLRPDTADDSGNTYILDSDVLVKTVSAGSVSVPAYGTADVSVTVTLTPEEKEELDRLFPNGTYIEGFVVLTADNDTDPQIGLPYLAFYGDWTAAPIFDSATWLDEPAEGESVWEQDCTWNESVLGYFDGYTFYNLGQNPFDSTAANTQNRYLQENITISPNGLFKSVNDIELYQLRDAKLMVVEVKDAVTGELYYRDYATYQFKTYFDYGYMAPIPSSLYYFTETYWDGTDLDGNVLPSGTECIYTITAYGDGDYATVAEGDYLYTDFESVIPGVNEPTFNGHAMDKTGDVISFNVMVDTVAPKLVNNAVTCYVGEDGHTYLTGTFTDDGSIASVEIRPLVKRTYKPGYGDPSYEEYGLDYDNPFLCEYIYDADVGVWTFKADVTEYVHANEAYSGENYYYNFEWTGNVYIYGGDYGGNDRVYAVTVDSTPGLALSQTSALLYVGGEFDLSVNDNTGSDAPLTRTSSNPDVATVDEFGHIVAIAPGQTIITVSNGTESAVCIVAVRERPTEVIDFDLSIEHFSTLTPNGEIIVKVTNLYPADVELTEIRWEVSEDEETAENYVGLINCEKYTSDGLTGLLYLNYCNYDPYNMGYPAIPGGSGTLTVTLNGVSRSMTLDWEDLYKTAADDDLISDLYGEGQTIYVTQGETATLIATYRQVHSFIDVRLCTMEGYQSYSSSNPLTESTGLVLEGPTFAANSSRWEGTLVNLEGYALPQQIKVVTRYSYGYESEMYYQGTTMNEWSQYGYSYDPETGKIVAYAPYGADNTMIIRADGVVSEGNPAGQVSGNVYEKPDSTYGPFDWTFTGGVEGTLETFENVSINYTNKNGAYFTPAEPGVSYITATSKDGTYSVDFAVICEPVKAETMDLDAHNVIFHVGDTFQMDPILTPEPTLESDQKLIYTSYNEDVVTVDENGLLTAVSEGYAYVHICVRTDTTVQTYCVVQVLPCEEHSYGEWTVTTEPGCETPGEESRVCSKCGKTETREIPALGHDYEAVVTDPSCTEGGYTTHTCSRCGDSYVDSYTDPTGHSYGDDGICGTCGEKDPNFTEPGEGGSSQTGDSFRAALWMSLLVFSGCGLALLVIRRNRKFF